MDAPLNICLQVNISGEDSKSGIEPDQLASLAQAVQSMPNLRLRGLMAIPDPSLSTEALRLQFSQMRTLFNQLKQQGYALDTLSMGMSNDYTEAILEGATMVRIGSAIFGERNKTTQT